jgi:hypothetical protein
MPNRYFDEMRERGDRGAQFKQSCALPLCNRERLMVTLLCRGSVASGVQQIASHPMYLNLADPLSVVSII